jgi:hypothetical protein
MNESEARSENGMLRK